VNADLDLPDEPYRRAVQSGRQGWSTAMVSHIDDDTEAAQ
jgi:hypothetical protein